MAVDVPGRAHRGDHRNHGGRVNDEIGARELIAPGLRLTHIAGNDVPGRIGREIRAADFSAETAIALGQGAADEAVGAGDEYPLRQHRMCRCAHW